MVSKTKLYSRLDSLETQLLELIVPHLKIAANGNNELLFCAAAFNPFRELKHDTDELTEELIEIGAQILVLRNKLGEASDGTIAERLCWYCREWSKTVNPKKPSSTALARQFLSEINKRNGEQ